MLGKSLVELSVTSSTCALLDSRLTLRKYPLYPRVNLSQFLCPAPASFQGTALVWWGGVEMVYGKKLVVYVESHCDWDSSAFWCVMPVHVQPWNVCKSGWLLIILFMAGSLPFPLCLHQSKHLWYSFLLERTHLFLELAHLGFFESSDLWWVFQKTPWFYSLSRLPSWLGWKQLSLVPTLFLILFFPLVSTTLIFLTSPLAFYSPLWILLIIKPGKSTTCGIYSKYNLILVFHWPFIIFHWGCLSQVSELKNRDSQSWEINKTKEWFKS